MTIARSSIPKDKRVALHSKQQPSVSKPKDFHAR
jgi:hypothetical protein